MYRYLTRNLQGWTCLCAQKTLPNVCQSLIFAPLNVVIQQNRGYSRRGPKKKFKRGKDLYEILELSQEATSVQIKGAYFRLSKKYHPDINKSEDAVEKFAEISEAYEILGKPDSRRLYDKGLREEEDLRNTGHPDGWKTYRKGFRKYDGPPVRGRTSIFDFDKWTRTHYSEVFAKKTAEKKRYDEFHADIGRQEVKKKSNTGDIGTELAIAFLIIPVIYFLLRSDIKFNNFQPLNDTDTFHAQELAKKKEADQSRLATSQDLETNLATD